MNFQVSEFCHIIDGREERVALFNALTLGIVILDSKTANIIRNAKHVKHRVLGNDDIQLLKSIGGESLIEMLKKHKIIFPLGDAIDIKEYAQIQGDLANQAIGILYLLLTDICNLSCTYCYVENALPNNHLFQQMKPQAAKYGIDLFTHYLDRECVEEPQIILYGGEPLINFDTLKFSLQYITRLRNAGELPESTAITINTNGTLINQEIINTLKLVDNLNVAISIDGPKDLNDFYRKYHSGKGTYEDIIRNVQLLEANGIKAGLCCTITEKNVENLTEIAKWFVDRFNVKSFGFNIMIESKHANTARGDSQNYASLAAQKMIECFRYFREIGVHEDRMMRKVEAFTEGYIYFYDCGGCGQQLVISPSGMIGVCQGYWGTKKFFVEPEEEFNPYQHPIWDLWRHRSPLFMRQCRDCIGLSLCGGGCPYSADMRNGDIWELDEIFCIHAKTTVEFLIQDLIEQTYREQS